MISQLEMEKRNLQSSLLFMQQDHSHTLKALHDEISKLQKRCSELTFQLTMQGISDSESNKQENEAKIKHLELLLKESEVKHKELSQELEKKSEIIKDLKDQLKRNERHHIEEMKSKDREVLSLRVELDNKSGTIASLTTEIHRLKVVRSEKHKPHTPPLRESESTVKSRESTARRRSSRAPSATAVCSRPVTAKANISTADAEIFLARAVPVEQNDVSVKPTPPVLPPITSNEDMKTFSKRQQLLRRRLDLKSQPELTTLAVDQLASNSNTFINEPNTTK